MLENFECWVRKKTDLDLDIVHNKNEYSESIVIDFDNDRFICRFTVWDDLSCMSEIMDAETGRYKLNQRDEFSSYNELIDIFNVFIRNIN
ncbi:hypothetical protein AB8W28_15065 [Cronobacter universalis]|uniref:Uncharacterized protein n=1 Tax=Cronobacter universalis NCTC 9529 TaxID=1074000 RepID=A0AAC8VLY7_9ENTR|nr:hypothetical protein [Cronobacter universalis]ALB53206.1 hypothetical protein AFK65_00330 [Cronobacter universalis NCTC 9529]STC96787.1 Uncharacterised protein [Cronobacter universalis NCTC 9529]